MLTYIPVLFLFSFIFRVRVRVKIGLGHRRRNRGVCGGGVNVPLTFGTRGVQGGAEGRSNEDDICFYSRQFLFSTVQVTYIRAFCLKTER